MGLHYRMSGNKPGRSQGAGIRSYLRRPIYDAFMSGLESPLAIERP